MSDTTETTQEPVAWLHEIVEPTEHAAEMLSRRPGNPWRHWIDSYKKECVYRATPLYAASPAPTAMVDAEPIYSLNKESAARCDLEDQLAGILAQPSDNDVLSGEHTNADDLIAALLSSEAAVDLIERLKSPDCWTFSAKPDHYGHQYWQPSTAPQEAGIIFRLLIDERNSIKATAIERCARVIEDLVADPLGKRLGEVIRALLKT